MYQDPSKIRDHIVKIRLNDAESDLIDALVNFTGEQKAALLREMLLDQARHVLIGEADFGRPERESEVPEPALLSA